MMGQRLPAKSGDEFVVLEREVKMQNSVRDQYEHGLLTGIIDAANGILEPDIGYPDSDPFREGVRRGRAAWRKLTEDALVVDREPLNRGES